MQNSTKPPQSRLLERPLAERSLAGVAASIANYTNIAVGFVRAAFVISIFFGGIGLGAYAAGWILIRAEGDDESLVEKWLGNAKSLSSWIGLGLLAIALIIVMGSIGAFSGTAMLAIGLVVLGVLAFRGSFDDGMLNFNRPRPPPPAAGAVDVLAPDAPNVADDDADAHDDVADDAHDDDDADGVAEGGSDIEAAREEFDAEIPVPVGGEPLVPTEPPSHVVTVPPRPPRRRSRLGRFTLAALLISVGSMAVADTGGVIDFSPGAYFAVALIMVGAGLAIGTVYGRAYSLVFIGLLLVAMLQVTSWFDLRLGGGFGDPTYRVESVVELESDYRLLAGQLRLDFSRLDPVGTVSTEVSLGAGEMLVELPSDVNLIIDMRVVVGELTTPDGTYNGTDLRRVFEHHPEGAVGTINIDAEVGFGQLHIDLDTPLGG